MIHWLLLGLLGVWVLWCLWVLLGAVFMLLLEAVAAFMRGLVAVLTRLERKLASM
jgi:hypothetical protein